MNLNSALRELKRRGTAQNRKVYRRHGVGENMYGVSIADLRLLAKQIKTDRGLAVQLWATGNHDAQILATLIADPDQFDAKTLDAWSRDLSNYVITDQFAGLVARTAYWQKKAEKWHRARGEWIGRAGWNLIGQLALHDPALPDRYFEPYLIEIETGIHQQKNRVREAMNNALIAIGVRDADLQDKALSIAHVIGPVEVDHGETNCKTPDATEYILRTVAHRQHRARQEKAYGRTRGTGPGTRQITRSPAGVAG
jgi:3-methyladenine DNA glycosylase AlkD